MKCEITLFALLKDRVGKSHLSLEVVEPVTGRALLDALCEDYPALLPLADTILISVNQDFANPEQVIGAGDEVVLFTPVSGG